MINLEMAKQIAIKEIERTCASQFGPFSIRDEHTIEKEYGWVFFYSTQKYVETRDVRYALAGNGPVIVERADGAVHMFGSAKPPEEIIREYELRQGYV